MTIQQQKRFQFLTEEDLVWEDLPVETRQRLLEQVSELVKQAWRKKKEVISESQNQR
ncbi:MAG: hypothetical protein JRH07_13770 [Deltaproteobacteria bacterium]|nr:hypothetical protein [Deltaproteobacteria bacterium]